MTKMGTDQGVLRSFEDVRVHYRDAISSDEWDVLSWVQYEQKRWVRWNFGERPSYQPLLGAFEELGELAHAHLKQEQGIRGSAEENEAKAKDAVADTVIFLADYCTARGWDISEIVWETWEQVRLRDFKADPENGGENG